jgi:O-methyltransferase
LSLQERDWLARVLDVVAAISDQLRLTSAVKAVMPTPLRQWVMKRRDQSLVPEDELRRWYPHVLKVLLERRAGRGLGDYLEFGVYRGDSLRCMYEALEAYGLHGVRLIGFDSFEGLPQLGKGDAELPWFPGDFAFSERETRARLAQAGIDMSRVHLVKGWYSDTLTQELARELGITKASVIMIDCDLYTSTKQALDFCAPFIEDDVVVFFDDWDGGQGLAERGLGEKRAFDEFLAERPELRAEELGTYFNPRLVPPAPAKIFLVSRSRL